MIKNKRVFVFFVLYFVLFGQNNIIKQKQVVDGVAAQVENYIILKSDLIQLVKMSALQSRINPQTNPEAFVRLQKNIIKQMVDQKIILEMAALDSVMVDEKEVTASLEQQVSNIVSQSGGEKKAEEMLGQSLKSFKREFWFDMQDRMISERYQQQLLSRIAVSREGVFGFYSEFQDSLPIVPSVVLLRHLLIKPSPSVESKKNAYSFLDSLRSLVVGGASFALLAKKHSADPGSSVEGGSLGFVNRGSFVKPFEQVAFSQPIGFVSQPVETEFGYDLIETLEKKGDIIKVRHILIQAKVNKEDERRAFYLALSLKDSSKTLKDYMGFVKRYSDDKSSSSSGGSLGWIDPKNYPVQEIGQAIKYVDLSACSTPINSSLGFHLLWVEKIKPGGKPTLKTHWSEIEEMALNYKKMKWYDSWIADARKNFYIYVNEGK